MGGFAWQPDADVFIVGAGPAGLTAAYCLTREKSSVIVIEKDPVYVGGISHARSRYKDFLFDIGGQRFFSKRARKSSTFGRKSCRTISSHGRGSRRFSTAENITPIRCSASEALKNLGVFARGMHDVLRLARLRPVGEPALVS